MTGWGQDLGDDCRAESPHVAIRVITAPGVGTFVPGECRPPASGGVPIAAGDAIGLLMQLGQSRRVTSPFTGLLMGLLALPGERVRIHQPLAWLTIDEEALNTRATD